MNNYEENVEPRGYSHAGKCSAIADRSQVGLMQLVLDMTPEEFKNNVVGLAKTAKIFDLPVILTTSVDWGPNGTILP